MNMNFNDPVNQVAGRDIINYIEQGLNERDLTEEQLKELTKQEASIAWEAKKAMILHPTNVIIMLFPFLLVGIMITSLFYPYLSFNLMALILIFIGAGGMYCKMRYKEVVQGEIGKTYLQAKNNTAICKAELTRRELVNKALKKSL